jgi:hypothetical protein
LLLAGRGGHRALSPLLSFFSPSGFFFPSHREEIWLFFFFISFFVSLAAQPGGQASTLNCARARAAQQRGGLRWNCLGRARGSPV